MPINPKLLQLSKKRSRQNLYEFLEGNYAKIPSGASVLSVGSGGDINDLLGKYAQTQGFRVTTIDIDPNRKPDLVGDICSYDFKENKFDVVVMGEVLEHLHSPQSGLDVIHGVLKPGGILLLSTPFILPIHDEPYDYFRFTRHGLQLLLRKFDPVDIKERNSYFEAIDVLWLRLLVIPSEKAKWLNFIIIPIVYYLARPITIMLTKFIPTNAMTTGYVVHATRKE